ncbi:sensor histidine kinase [Stieleria varia]|uniref:histidine kinase n=1 Tax=Stieleria varia TaxID=2528005 RepID=A0A5C6AYT9_9BACT|nr:ATP-binding protein [Stieleria varia]TWU04292.1 Phytochrome-like protein cph1 [Stieleria varia]
MGNIHSGSQNDPQNRKTNREGEVASARPVIPIGYAGVATLIALLIVVLNQYASVPWPVSVAVIAILYAPLFFLWFRPPPRLGETKRVTAPLGFLGGVSASRETELALRKSEDRFRKLIEHAPEAVVVYDLERGHLVVVNRAAEFLFKLPASELHARDPVRDLSPQFQPNGRESGEMAGELIQRAIQGETPVFEWTHIDGDGNPILCEVRLLAFELDDRPALRGSVIDIRERKRIEKELQDLAVDLEIRVRARTIELEQLNEDLKAFAFTVSHDLRAPLRAVCGFADALAEDFGDRLGDSGNECISDIQDAANRMDTMISDLLIYSRLGYSDLRLRVVGLDAVVNEAMEALRAEIQSSEAIVNVRSPLPTVIGDHATLVDVFYNLIGNAIKFVAKDRQPIVNVYGESLTADNAAPTRVRIWVDDNGIGVNEAYCERIFRVFSRLHGVERYPGTGIGLAIVARACEKLNGSCGMEPQQDEGSRFWIELPLGA